MKRFLQLVLLGLVVGGANAQEKMNKFEKGAAKMEKKAGRGEKESGSTPPAGQGYEGFRYVRTRNIFDPTRRGPRVETPPNASATAATRRVRSLSLTGTMVTAGRALAFFGGAESRVIGVGESVANFKVTKINASQVSLERDGKALQLDVGKQIALEGAAGEPVEGAPVVEAAVPDAAPAVPGLPAPPATGGDKNEILRRMMERRAKEEGK